MGKLDIFKITFSLNKEVYRPGEMIDGQVNIQLNRSMKMSGIKMKFDGKAFVQWSEDSVKSRQYYSTTNPQWSTRNDLNRQYYSATETFFRSKQYVYGKGTTADDTKNELDSGVHNFPFTFQLPSPLPSSFEDKLGYVRYSVKATIVRQWKFNKKTKVYFTVLDKLDLNRIPDALSLPNSKESKNLCCFCCVSGLISCDLHLNRKAFVSGEWIVINASVENNSNLNVKKTTCEIIQRVTYHAVTKSKTTERVVTQITGQECCPQSTISWTDTKIQIPPVPPSELSHCRIIDIAYFLRFCCHLRMCTTNLTVYVPIVIGTVPLHNGTPSNQVSHTSAPQVLSLDPDLTPDSLANQCLPTALSYAKSASGSVNIAYSVGQATGKVIYTPQYTYYDWEKDASSST